MIRFCVKCEVELRCTKTGAIAVAMSTTGPLSARACDVFGCPICKHESVCGAAVGELASCFTHDLPTLLTTWAAEGKRVVLYWNNQREKESIPPVVVGGNQRGR